MACSCPVGKGTIVYDSAVSPRTIAPAPASTVEVVHRHLLGALLRGELKPGEWLRQDELAASLGVSKIPVREALQRLSAEAW